jgi:hypothetical protein
LLAAGCGGSYATPVIELPDPPVPGLITADIDGWEDAGITSVCIEVSVEGDLREGDFGMPEGFLTEVVAAFGVQVVSDGCDARLTVEMSARRIAANYQGGGECYSGDEQIAAATLSMPGRPDAVGTFEWKAEPPDVIAETSCSKDPTVPVDDWEEMLVHPRARHGVLNDLFGGSMLLAAMYTEAGQDGWEYEIYEEHTAGEVVNDESVEMIIYHLAGDDRDRRIEAAQFARDLADKVSVRDRRGLEPVIPYLIRSLALEDEWELQTVGTIYNGKDSLLGEWGRRMPGSALQGITGRQLGYRADRWWDWWQQQR